MMNNNLHVYPTWQHLSPCSLVSRNGAASECNPRGGNGDSDGSNPSPAFGPVASSFGGPGPSTGATSFGIGNLSLSRSNAALTTSGENDDLMADQCMPISDASDHALSEFIDLDACEASPRPAPDAAVAQLRESHMNQALAQFPHMQPALFRSTDSTRPASLHPEASLAHSPSYWSTSHPSHPSTPQSMAASQPGHPLHVPQLNTPSGLSVDGSMHSSGLSPYESLAPSERDIDPTSHNQAGVEYQTILERVHASTKLCKVALDKFAQRIVDMQVTTLVKTWEVLDLLSTVPPRIPEGQSDWIPMMRVASDSLQRLVRLTEGISDMDQHTLANGLKGLCAAKHDLAGADLGVSLSSQPRHLSDAAQTIRPAASPQPEYPTLSSSPSSASASSFHSHLRQHLQEKLTSACPSHHPAPGPYFCLRDGCHVTFLDKQAWIRHQEGWDPCRLWWCSEHPKEFHHRRGRLDHHVTQRHPNGARPRTEEVLTPTKTRTCPICPFESDDWDSFYRVHVPQCMKAQPDDGSQQDGGDDKPRQQDFGSGNAKGPQNHNYYGFQSGMLGPGGGSNWTGFPGNCCNGGSGDFTYQARLQGQVMKPNLIKPWNVVHLVAAANWFSRCTVRGTIRPPPEVFEKMWQTAVRDKVLTFLGASDPMSNYDIVLVRQALEKTPGLMHFGAHLSGDTSTWSLQMPSSAGDVQKDFEKFQAMTFDAASEDSGYFSREPSRAVTPDVIRPDDSLGFSRRAQSWPICLALDMCCECDMLGCIHRKSINQFFEIYNGIIRSRTEGSGSWQAWSGRLHRPDWDQSLAQLSCSEPDPEPEMTEAEEDEGQTDPDVAKSIAQLDVGEEEDLTACQDASGGHTCPSGPSRACLMQRSMHSKPNPPQAEQHIESKKRIASKPSAARLTWSRDLAGATEEHEGDASELCEEPETL